MQVFLTFDDAAERISAAGLPITRRGVECWADRHPDLKFKIGGRVGIHRDALNAIIGGMPVRAVAARMRERRAAVERECAGGKAA